MYHSSSYWSGAEHQQERRASMTTDQAGATGSGERPSRLHPSIREQYAWERRLARGWRVVKLGGDYRLVRFAERASRPRPDRPGAGPGGAT
jgi:hypothetical protein